MNRDTIVKYLRIFIISTMLIFGAAEILNTFQNITSQWYWLILAIIYTTLINDVFCHRICSHNMFKINVNSYTYKLLTWLASVDMGYGPVKWIVMSHSLHHIHSDNGPEDVMNWRHHWYSTTIVSPIPRKNVKPTGYEKYILRQKRKNLNIINDKWTDFCAIYQCEISVTTLLILYFLFPIFLFKVIFTGRLLLSIMTGLAGIAGHIKNFPGSYRNFDTADTTSNNFIFHVLFLGLFAGMLQNNHHGRPRAERPNQRWWEFDASWPLVKILKMLIENPILTKSQI